MEARTGELFQVGSPRRADVEAATGGYRVRVSQALEDPAWDAFLARAFDGHHVQNSAWAQVKSALGWRSKRVVLNGPSGPVAGAQILFRSVHPIGNMAFLSRGPVWASGDDVLFRQTMREILKVTAEERARAVVVQLPRTSDTIAEELLAMGFRATPVTPTPRATILVDLNPDLDEILSRMRRSGRKAVRRSLRNGVAVREGTEADVATFCGLADATSRRQGFKQFEADYFKQMWHTLEPRGQIKLFVAEYEGEAVAAQIVVAFGDRVVAKHFGWSGAHGSRSPSEALDWATIGWAKSRGYRYFDLDGINLEVAQSVVAGEPTAQALAGRTGYKLRFGGRVHIFPPAFCYIPNSVLRWAHAGARRGIANSQVFRGLVHRMRTSPDRG